MESFRNRQAGRKYQKRIVLTRFRRRYRSLFHKNRRIIRAGKQALRKLHQFVRGSAQTDVLCVLLACLPVRVTENRMEVIVRVAILCNTVGKKRTGERIRGVYGIDTGLVKRNRVKRREHPDILNDRRVVFRMAVTVGRNIHDNVDMEVRTALADSLGIFGNLADEILFGGVVCRLDRIKPAQTDAAAAADTFVMVDDSLIFFCEGNGALRAIVCTHVAAAAEFGINGRFAAVVLFHFPGAGAGPHAQVLNGAAETGELMSFEMV